VPPQIVAARQVVWRGGCAKYCGAYRKIGAQSHRPKSAIEVVAEMVAGLPKKVEVMEKRLYRLSLSPFAENHLHVRG